METLPIEIKDKILNYFPSGYLDEIISAVSEEWASIATKILGTRVDRMLATVPEHTLVEIRSRLHPSFQNENGYVLLEYEKAFLRSKFRIESHKCWRENRVDSKICAGELIQKIQVTRGCDCVDVDLCLVRAIHFMPCHKLMLVQLPEKIAFYGAADIHYMEAEQSVPCGVREYTPGLQAQTQNIWIDNNSHTAISVYKDLVVAQETTRVMILFRVLEVNHSSRTIVLESVRRIFLPVWSYAVLMLEDKICTLFTTGSVGIWSRSKDDISVSRNTCGNVDVLRTMRVSRMYSVGDLVLVKIISDGESPVSWTIFDSSSSYEDFVLHSISLKDIIGANLLKDREECIEVIDVFLSVNAFAVYATVLSTENSTPKNKLIVRRIKQNPTLEDFITPLKFNDLFYQTDIAMTFSAELPFEGSLTMPFVEVSAIPRSMGLNNSGFSFLGLLKNNKSRNQRIVQ